MNDNCGIPPKLVNDIFICRMELRQGLRTNLQTAFRLGDLLHEAKSHCRHGEWGSWLKDKFEGKVREPQRYMQLAAHFPAEARESREVRELTLTEALNLVTKQREPTREDVTSGAVTVESLTSIENTLSRIGDAIQRMIITRLEAEGLTKAHRTLKAARRLHSALRGFHSHVREELLWGLAEATATTANETVAAGVLGLAVPFTSDELDAAYREAVKLSHPDAGGTEEAFRYVQEAYECLKATVEERAAS